MNSPERPDNQRTALTPDGSPESFGALDLLIGPITPAKKNYLWSAGASALVGVHSFLYLSQQEFLSLCYFVIYPILVAMYLNREQRERFRAFAAMGQKVFAFVAIFLVVEMLYYAHVRQPTAVRQSVAPRPRFAIVMLVLATASFILSIRGLLHSSHSVERNKPPLDL
jgi:hypothetical protein